MNHRWRFAILPLKKNRLNRTFGPAIEENMSKFVIEAHFRLQEWVAEEKGYFRAEGLDLNAAMDAQR